MICDENLANKLKCEEQKKHKIFLGAQKGVELRIGCLYLIYRWRLIVSPVKNNETLIMFLSAPSAPRTFCDLKDVVRLHHPEIMFLYETKSGKKKMKDLRIALKFSNYLTMDSRGRAGDCVYCRLRISTLR